MRLLSILVAALLVATVIGSLLASGRGIGIRARLVLVPGGLHAETGTLENFIPNVWASKILQALDTALVYPQLMSTDYEGDIKDVGDTVRINMVGDVTISNYSKNTDMNAPETLTDGQTVLKIDQAKYFNFAIDDIDGAQQSPKVMGEAARRAAYGLRKVTDSFCASLYTDISASNLIGSDGAPITGTWNAAGTQAYDRLVDLGVLLDNNDVPDEGRFVVVPPWYEGYLLKDNRFVSGATAEAIARLTNGRLDGQRGTGVNGYCGRAAGFDVYKSNQVPNTASLKYKVIAGHPMAWAYADQVTKVEGYRPERRFADALKGLHLYGAKVVRPYALALLTGNPA